LVRGTLLLLGFTLLVWLAFVSPEPAGKHAGSITSMEGAGSKALAQVLRANGVNVNQVTSFDDAIAAAVPGTTLAIYLDLELDEAAVARLNQVPADVVIIAARSWQNLAPISGDTLWEAGYWWDDPDSAPHPGCDDPDVQAAGELSPSDTGVFSGWDTAEVCYPDADGYGLYANMHTGRHRLTVLTSPKAVANSTIADYGNAALALRMLGRHSSLTWYLPSEDVRNQSANTEVSKWSLLPTGAKTMLILVLIAGLAAAWWKGRRLGQLVGENLPVAMPASEVSLGLGRLYKQSKTRGHAGAALRAQTVWRLAKQLGLPPNCEPALVVARIAAAAGKDERLVGYLLYGPAPADDNDLLELTHGLRELESETRPHV
jgi:hypothetical protein